MDILLYFVFGTVAVTLIGHGLWVLCAQVWRALVGASPPPRPPAPRPNRDLDIAIRVLRSLLAGEVLNEEAGREVLSTLEKRRAGLEARTAPEREPHASPAATLQRLLRRCDDVRQLDANDRKRCLALLRELDAPEVDRFPLAVQSQLAQLLRLAGLTSRAITLYRRMLNIHPDADESATIALDAARFATRERRPEDALPFLEHALRGNLNTEDRQLAEELLGRLRPQPQAHEVAPAAPTTQPETPTPTAPAEMVPVVLEVIEEPPQPPVEAVPAFAARLVVEPDEPIVAPPPVHVPVERPVERPVRHREPTRAPVRAPEREPEPVAPRRSFTEMLAGFMEDRNILWGELVGGLLIVGCSIALVITLWQTLEQIPYFPFLIFASITMALFGAGTYTFYRWKLRNTSRGLLVISMLLVPLNMLVLAGLARERGGDWIQLLASVAAVALFAFVIRVAGRAIAAPGENWLVLGVVGTAAAQLLVPPFLDATSSPWLLFLFACLPVICQMVAVQQRLRQEPETITLDRPRILSLLLFLGLTCFTVAVTLGFFLARGYELGLGWQRLALPLAAAGGPICTVGLILQRRLRLQAISDDAQELAGGLITVATGVVLAGMMVLIGAIGVAWPAPLPVLAVCLFNTGLVVVLALRHRLPWAHAFAVPCAALAVAVLSQMAAETIPLLGTIESTRLVERLTSASSLAAVVVLVAVLAAVAEWLFHRDEELQKHARSLSFCALGLGGVVLLLSLHLARTAPAALAWIYGLCALTSLATTLRWKKGWLSHGGWLLLLLATLWSLQAFVPGRLDWWMFVVALEALAFAVLAVLHGHNGRIDFVGTPAANDISAPWYRPLTVGCQSLMYVAAALVVAFGLASLDVQTTAWQPHTLSALLLTVTLLLIVWVHGKSPFTYLAGLSFWFALTHFLARDLPAETLEHPALLAVFLHATLLVLIGQSLRWWLPAAVQSLSRVEASQSRAGRIYYLYALPLPRAGQYTSGLALVATLWIYFTVMQPLGLYLLWVAALWLAFAWIERSRIWFAGFQSLVYLGVSCLACAWLETQPWVLSGSRWSDPRNLQTWGLTMTALCLLFLSVRRLLRRSERATYLLEANSPTVDRLMLAALVLGQLLVPTAHLIGEFGRELYPRGQVLPPAAEAVLLLGAWPGWCLLAALVVALLGSLWQRRNEEVLVGLVLLALSAAVLVACPFTIDQAAASALRWSLALVFVACSVAIWNRGTLATLAARLQIDTEFKIPLRNILHGVLLVGAPAPVLLLTFAIARLGFAGLQPSGPTPGSFFAELGVLVNNLGPLVLLCGGLVGHAVRERSAGYAFWAGQLANTTLVGGYALLLVTNGQVIDLPLTMRLVQLGTLGAAVWALGWMLVRPWVYAWRETAREEWQPESQSRLLMLLQLAIAVIGGLVLCLVGVQTTLRLGLHQEPSLADVALVRECGMPLAWVALALTAVAVGLWQRQAARELSWHGVLVALVSALVLLACNLSLVDHDWGYRTLLLGSAALALLVALGQFVEGRRLGWAGLPAFPSSLPMVPWVIGLGVASFGLAFLLLTYRQEQQLWAASAIALSSLAGVGIALWRREEGWILGYGLGFNLAATLVVLHFAPIRQANFEFIWIVQTNLATSAVVALLWLAGQYRLRKSLDSGLSSLLLGIQVLPTLAGQALFLLLPASSIVLYPEHSVSEPLRQFGMPGGWLSLALVMVAGYTFMARWMPQGRIAMLGYTAVGVGLLTATVVDRWASFAWPAYQTLLLTWSLAGGGALALALVARADTEGRVLSRWGWLRWVEIVSVALLFLACRGAVDNPLRPWATVAPALLVVLLLGTLAPLGRYHTHVYLSGLALVVAGVLAWYWNGPATASSLFLVLALTLALGALLWTALAAFWLDRTGFEIRAPLLPYPYLAASLAVTMIAAGTLSRWGQHLALGIIEPLDPLTLPTCAVSALALTALLWEKRGWFAVLGLYILTLCTTLLALDQLLEPSRALQQASLVAGAGFVLAWSVLSWLRLFLGEKAPIQLRARTDQIWFAPLQSALGLLVILASLWLCNLPGHVGPRLLAPLALGLLTVAGVVLFWVPRTATVVRLLQPATLIVGVLTLIEMGWAVLDNDVAPLLHHVSVVLIVVTAMALVYRSMATLLRGQWQEPCRIFSERLPFVAWGVLLLTMALQMADYKPALKSTSLDGLEIAQIGASIVVLIALAIRWALVPALDPLGTRIDRDGTQQGRQLYVYLAEVFLVLLFVHMRLNVPQLFSGQMGKYWTFIVMGIAFIGVGVGEAARRRGLHVLGEPLQRTGLFLPLLPLLVFWLRPPEVLLTTAEQASPGLVPMMTYLRNLEHQFHHYAVLWMMLGAIYTLLAVWRKSMTYGLLAALAANVGFWSILGHFEMSLLVHPQMWLIPLALIALVAEHLNRDQLSKEQSLGLRYGGLIMIYVSSTADLFIAGLGESTLLPVILAVLCVVGVLAGVLLRVRAFLYLGVSFLCVDIFTMIWHAARDRQQTWVWYVSGIVLGTLILAIFAVFEKRRDDVLQLIDRLKQWE